MANLTQYDIQFYLDRLRMFAMEAMHKNLQGVDAGLELLLIGLCAEAMEGDDSAIRTLKTHGVDPEAPE